MTTYTCYSPSVLSELLTMIAAICGVVIGVTGCYWFDVSGVLFWLVTFGVTAVLALPVWYAFGYGLEFNKSTQEVTVRTRLLGGTLWRRVYSFADVRSITMHYDGDAFPYIRVTLTNSSEYCFCAAQTERDYRLLVGLFGRPAQISAGEISPLRA